MVAKAKSGARNVKTGSYTIRVHKSATTGKFIPDPKPRGKKIVRGTLKKAS